jgi:hypothetical protein
MPGLRQCQGERKDICICIDLQGQQHRLVQQLFLRSRRGLKLEALKPAVRRLS